MQLSNNQPSPSERDREGERDDGVRRERAEVQRDVGDGASGHERAHEVDGVGEGEELHEALKGEGSLDGIERAREDEHGRGDEGEVAVEVVLAGASGVMTSPRLA